MQLFEITVEVLLKTPSKTSEDDPNPATRYLRNLRVHALSWEQTEAMIASEIQAEANKVISFDRHASANALSTQARPEILWRSGRIFFDEK